MSNTTIVLAALCTNRIATCCVTSVLFCSVPYVNAHAFNVSKVGVLRPMRTIHRKIMKATSAMPLVGKSDIRTAIRTLQLSDGKTEAVDSFCSTMTNNIAAHGLQTLMGIHATMYRMDQLVQHPSLTSTIAFGIAGLYSVANAAVTYTQVGITHKVLRNFLNKRDKKYRPIAIAPVEDSKVWKDGLITNAGQVAFGVIYLPYFFSTVTHLLL